MKTRKFYLRFFQDDATGDYGLAHKDTIDEPSPFNAFWNGQGIFHDVFEHNHEFRNKYFMGDYAMNIGGEMTAMGAMWYYIDEMDLAYERSFNPHNPIDGHSMRITTEQEIQEAIHYGYCHYGDTLMCNIPYQKPTENILLEEEIKNMWENVKTYGFKNEDEDDKDRSYKYKRSVTLDKIQRLHRYGFYMAQRWIPDNSHNRSILRDFLQYWGEFTSHNKAEDLHYIYKGIEFVIGKEYGKIEWKAKLLSNVPYEYPDAKINPNLLEYSIY